MIVMFGSSHNENAFVPLITLVWMLPGTTSRFVVVALLVVVNTPR
jgi:hypothetical protein